MRKITDLLQEIDFCEQNLREFKLSDETVVPYYCCKKGYKALETDAIVSIYSRYLIIDLREEKTRAICEKNIFCSGDMFDAFQKSQLSKVFFYETDAVRFNIYLVFVIENNCDITNKEWILQNTDYARKLFFDEEGLLEYFLLISNLYRKADESRGMSEISGRLRSMVENLDKNKAKSLLFPSDYLTRVIGFFDSDCGSLDEYLKENKNVGDILSQHFLFRKGRNTSRSERIRRILELKIESFYNNCFENGTSFQATGVNVVVGNNASGKSTLFDAIEFGFTKKIHRYGKIRLDDSKVEVTTEPKFDFKKDENERKKNWYPECSGDLNELFRRANYFDTDVAVQFALDHGNEPQRYIEKMFCDNSVLESERALEGYNEAIDSMVSAFRLTELYSGSKRNIFRLLSSNKSKGADNVFNSRIELLNKLKTNCLETLESINAIKKNQISSNIEMINMIFQRLFSREYEVELNKESDFCLKIVGRKEKGVIEIPAMSTAQKVCLALSIMFTQFILASDAPNFILLDESVANLDSFHLLNLLDFLRELFVQKGVQVFFSTAMYDVSRVAKSKFQFLNDDFALIEILKDSNGFSYMNKKKEEGRDVQNRDPIKQG